MSQKKSLVFTLVGLLSISLSLVFLQQLGLNRVFVLDPNNQEDVIIYTLDDSSDGGTTYTELSMKDGAYYLMCDMLDGSHPYPYCSLTFDTRRGGNRGVDLSVYTDISLKVSYVDGGDTPVRLQMRNNNPAYSRDANPVFDKFNVVEYRPSVEGNEITFPLSYLRPADWWISQNNIDLLHSSTDLSNVMSIEIGTPVGLPADIYTLEIKEIRLIGKWLTYTQVISFIMAMWITVALGYLLFISYRLIRENREKGASLEHLETVNSMLESSAKRYKRMSITDPLTGLFNRAGASEVLSTYLNKSSAEHTQFSLIMCDLDNFKKINDYNGHAVGDEVIKDAAKLLREKTRISDSIVRWGGEEFLIICPETDLASANIIAEKLRDSFLMRRWPKGLRVTASLGVGQAKGFETFEQMVERVDQAMYRAKDAGRNRVEAA